MTEIPDRIISEGTDHELEANWHLTRAHGTDEMLEVDRSLHALLAIGHGLQGVREEPSNIANSVYLRQQS